jgi:hypothetical protein
MDKQTIKQVIADQTEEIASRISEDVTQREGVDSCASYLKYPNLLLVSGMRRVGKSFFSHLTAGTKSYLSLDFDDERLAGFTTRDLNLVLECFAELGGKQEILLFDELQNIRGWELFAGRLRNTRKVIITGSNAHLLSRELATHLTGRYMEYALFPMSFREFCDFRKEPINLAGLRLTRVRGRAEALLADYMTDGGIFDRYKFGPAFLRTLWRSIIDRDVVIRYRIKYPELLDQLALLLVNSFTSKISLLKLARHFHLKSSHTVADYIRFLENVFLVFQLPKFSHKIREQQSAFKKIYISDAGFISALGSSLAANRGRLLENLVAVELKRRCAREEKEFYYWDDYHHECDFIVREGGKITAAIQVCAELTPMNRDRELTGAIRAAGEFGLKKAVLLTFSQDETVHIGDFTIDIMPVCRWLLETQGR